MPRVGFEPTIPVFERLKTVRALDCAANWIGSDDCEIIKFWENSLGSCSDTLSRFISLTVTYGREIYELKILIFGSELHFLA